jgi:subfamily B ATP-binding cassette protein MsbA
LAGIIDPARKLSTTYAKLKRAGAAADRIFEMMDEKPRIEEPVSPTDLPRHSVEIEFDNIHFVYARSGPSGVARPAALEGVSLKVAAGEVIAVVGENGSGKSTLVNLLPRLYDPDFGSVRIDGIDIRTTSLAALRDQIAVVTQETVLFDDTIYENVRYGRTTATRAEIEDAAARSYVSRFFDQLPEGIQTRVGEKGGRLSGGQRQRVALARAILRNPSILILDEATSATDAQSERLIHEALLHFVGGRTTFLITHAVTPSVLELIDKVAVMDHGRLIAFGTHEQVLATCPVYERLFHARGRRGLAPGEIDPERLQPATSSGDAIQTASARDDGSAPTRPEILPLPLARGVRVAAQSAAAEERDKSRNPLHQPSDPGAVRRRRDAS